MITLDPVSHIYRDSETKEIYPGITEILHAEGFVDFSKVDPRILDRAQKFGTALHKACELWDKHDLDETTLSAPLVPYLAAYKKFLADFGLKFKPSEIEQIVYSKKWKIAGRPDRKSVIINKRRTRLDIKTNTALYPAIGLQMEGYNICEEEMTGLRTVQRWGIQLKEDGKYEIEPYANPADRVVFLSAVNTFKWKSAHIRRKEQNDGSDTR